MRTKVKICGLTRPEDIEAAIAGGADILGFIIEANSPRRLSAAQAARLTGPLKTRMKTKPCALTAAVTVDADNDLIADIAGGMDPDIFQLHGSESPARTRQLKNALGRLIIKALPVRTAKDLLTVHTYQDAADYILLDAKPPKDNAQKGGHGTAFDWKILRGFQTSVPLILAGGLSADTLAQARKITGLDFFDVSSGVEAAPGLKDAAKIAQFMQAAKG